jgi:membrane protease YdiL (CAAX protease family)
MGKDKGVYLKATRHPVSCFLFILPLLLIYEGGVFWMGGERAEGLRNGVDAWVRWGLNTLGASEYLWVPPCLIGVFFLHWAFKHRGDRPDDLPGIWCGMALECVIFAVGLCALGRALVPLLGTLEVKSTPPSQPPVAVAQAITFVGAGLYEEVLFRLILLSALRAVLTVVGVSKGSASTVATLVSAGLFAAAHHLGPFGETFDSRVFLFRMAAGAYFSLLYLYRGFGVGAGTHACYDVMVGVTV